MNKLSSVDLSYKIGSLISKQNNFKLKSIDGTKKIYCFKNKSNVCMIVFYNTINRNNYTFYLKNDTDISDVVDFFDLIFQKENINDLSLEISELENLVLDRIENIFYIILTEDKLSIKLDESFIDFSAKDGDILNKRLMVDEFITKKVKNTIDERFNSLKK